MHTIQPKSFQCRHIHTDGRRCGSPSLRGPDGPEHFCYYHHKTRRPGPRQPQVKTLTHRKASTFDLPTPAELGDRSGVQLAIAQVLHKIAHNEIDPRRAGLLLYGLQIASRNLPREPKPNTRSRYDDELEDTVEELTLDPVHGPVAPEATVEDLRPKSTVRLLIEEFEQRGREQQEKDEDEDNEDDTFSLHAAAETHPRSRPKTILVKTLRKKYRWATRSLRSTAKPNVRCASDPLPSTDQEHWT